MASMLKQYFPNRKFKALLFDFDGTVADTMGAHLNAWNTTLAIYNLSLSREQHLSWAGRPTRMILQLLNDLHKTQIHIEDFMKAKEALYLSSLNDVKEIISVVDIVKHYHGQLPMAIVTGSRRKVVETSLAHLELSNYFDLLVCAEDYLNGKPAPDCFLMAAELLKISPSDCLVFEDAVLGVQAAHNAEMACLKVDDQHKISITNPI